MDELTVGAYERGAGAYADDWEGQPAPVDLHALVESFFYPGPTADVGCGSGRDTAWLAEHGFQTIGYDPSPALLDEARRRHPGVAFELARLPDLDGVPRASFANVVCETVIMHLEPSEIEPSVTTLLDILAPEGTLYLSWRVTPGGDVRDDAGRLYAAFEPELVREALTGATVLYEDELTSASSGRIVHRIVARKR
jgi:SAM-dependent methyltransferase